MKIDEIEKWVDETRKGVNNHERFIYDKICEEDKALYHTSHDAITKIISIFNG